MFPWRWKIRALAQTSGYMQSQMKGQTIFDPLYVTLYFYKRLFSWLWTHDILVTRGQLLPLLQGFSSQSIFTQLLLWALVFSVNCRSLMHPSTLFSISVIYKSKTTNWVYLPLWRCLRKPMMPWLQRLHRNNASTERQRYKRNSGNQEDRPKNECPFVASYF